MTIALTYRNRNLNIVKKCFESLQNQSFKNFEVIMVNYGSKDHYTKDLIELVEEYSFIKLINCPVSGQLWSKCRAINIALKLSKTDYFLVGDIDLIFHPDFVKIANQRASNVAVYFLYSFLSKKESLQNKSFEEYEIDFLGSHEITGTTLFPRNALIEVNGYDEFYHGWGAEDTDIHIRLKQSGLKIEFYDEKPLLKHQWHPKAYRSKNSTSPFHSDLEKINYQYMLLTEKKKRIKANLHHSWGLIPDATKYGLLNDKPDYQIHISTADTEFAALLVQLQNFEEELVKIQIIKPKLQNQLKQAFKRILKKKYLNYLDLERINNLLLEEIIKYYRNSPYCYSFNRQKREIELTIYFSQ